MPQVPSAPSDVYIIVPLHGTGAGGAAQVYVVEADDMDIAAQEILSREGISSVAVVLADRYSE